jgi:UDP-N-acetylmuramoyl-L-alanyl-D-glutamate--2,6-diaminopimelate ligase
VNLADLLSILPEKTVLCARGDGEVKGVAYDSRRVGPGFVFVCIRGFKRDGHDFAAEAVGRGAAAIVAEREVPSGNVPLVLVPDSRTALALLSSQVFSHPSKRLRVIGVTGTNGKTTTTHVIRGLLSGAGRKTGLIGTVENVVCGKTLPVERTTPEAPDLQEMFSAMAACATEYAVIEVSSHALELRRTAGTEFDVAVFTNLTQDHLDFHRDIESYFRAKRRLFESLGSSYHLQPKEGAKRAVVNLDDPYGRRLRDDLKGSGRTEVVTYGFGAGADFRAAGVEVGPHGSKFTLLSPAGEVRLATRLAGRHNVYNALAAMAVVLSEGVPLDDAASEIERQRSVAGRFELVEEGQPFAVVVDYAHTPDGLRNVLEAARGIASGRLICVFGCGGDRDRTKRPIMGEVAARLADYCVITSDNPRSEDPLAIISEIEPGLRLGGKARGGYALEPDRKAAIRMALDAARAGDVVVIAGKGHETYQVFRDRTVHFDDREVAREVLRCLKS